MVDPSSQLIAAVNALQDVADTMPADQAAAKFDAVTLQVFWREWPSISGWAGSLWRQLNEELGEPASPVADPDRDETGGSG